MERNSWSVRQMNIRKTYCARCQDRMRRNKIMNNDPQCTLRKWDTAKQANGGCWGQSIDKPVQGIWGLSMQICPFSFSQLLLLQVRFLKFLGFPEVTLRSIRSLAKHVGKSKQSFLFKTGKLKNSLSSANKNSLSIVGTIK